MPRGQYERKAKQELVPVKSSTTELVIIQSKMDKAIEGLDKTVQAEVKNETRAFLDARDAFGHAGMEMGRHLARIRDLLEPIKRWKLWVRTVPNMSTSTAYRFINTWENAQKTLPPATLKVALLGGHRIISQDKDAGWLGIYKDAAENVTKRLGPPPAVDEGKAKKWVDELIAERRHLVKLGQGAKADQEVELEPLEIQILNKFENLLERIPDDRKEAFATRVIGMLMTAAKDTAGVAFARFKPVPLPQEIVAGQPAA
jgi:hypothetical protein